MEPGKVYELTVDLWSTSLIFNRGHKIRVAVSSSNAPRFDPNPNTGHGFRADKESRVATNTIHFSKEIPVENRAAGQPGGNSCRERKESIELALALQRYPGRNRSLECGL